MKLSWNLPANPFLNSIFHIDFGWRSLEFLLNLCKIECNDCCCTVDIKSRFPTNNLRDIRHLQTLGMFLNSVKSFGWNKSSLAIPKSRICSISCLILASWDTCKGAYITVSWSEIDIGSRHIYYDYLICSNWRSILKLGPIYVMNQN